MIKGSFMRNCRNEFFSSVNMKMVDPLQEAVLQGDTHRLRALLDDVPRASALDIEGKSLLHIAAIHDSLQSIPVLLQAGIDVDIPDSDGNTAVHYAVAHHSTNVLSHLLRSGADPNTKGWIFVKKDTGKDEEDDDDEEEEEVVNWTNFDSITPLNPNFHSMTPRKSDDSFGSNRGDGEMVCAMHDAAIADNADGAQLLLNAGASAHMRDNREKTPLHDAAICYHSQVAKVLIQAGADVNVRDRDGKTALHYVVDSRNIRLARAMSEASARIDLINRRAINYEKMNQNAVEFVKLLIEHGANVNSSDSFGKTALHYAAAYSMDGCGPTTSSTSSNTTSALNNSSHSANSDRPGSRGLLMHAPTPSSSRGGGSRSGSLVSLCSPRGISSAGGAAGGAGTPRSRSNSRTLSSPAGPGLTSGLVSGLGSGQQGQRGCEIVQLLLKAGALVDVSDRFGNTPIYDAMMNDQSKIARLLARAGADVNALDGQLRERYSRTTSSSY